MSKQKIVRLTCERGGCGHIEEVPGGLFSRYPSSWKNVEGAWICPKCTEVYQRMVERFMRGKE